MRLRAWWYRLTHRSQIRAQQRHESMTRHPAGKRIGGRP